MLCAEGTGRHCPLLPHKGLAEGNALDLKEASLLEGFDLAIQGTDRYDDAKDSDIVVVTAGLPRQPGMSREELLKRNAAIVWDSCVEIVKFSPEALLIMVTTPVDAMVHVAASRPPSRSAGSWEWPTFWTPSISNLYRLGTQGALEGTSVLRLVRLHGATLASCPSRRIPITDLLSADRIQSLIERTRKAREEILALEKVSSPALPRPSSSNYGQLSEEGLPAHGRATRGVEHVLSA